jgi:hypothetical protein
VVVVIDCSQLDRSAELWCSALGYVRDGVATGQYQSLRPASGTGIDWRWHILGGPDGNEMCVLEPPASYWRD